MNLEAALIVVQLAAPLGILLAPHRRLAIPVVLVFGIQCLAIWLGGCITFTWQCPAACTWITGACDHLGDEHDAAPFGVALLALLSLAMLAASSLVKWLYIRWRGSAGR